MTTSAGNRAFLATIWAAAAVGVGVAAWLLARPRPTAQPAVAPSSARAVESGSDSSGFLERPGSERSAPERAPGEARGNEPRAKTILLSGTLTLANVAPEQRGNASGMFVLQPQRGEASDVAVEDGTWRAFVRTDTPFDVTGIEIDGRRAILLRESGPFVAPESGSLDLVAHLVQDKILHVVDAESGAHLDDVEVVGIYEDDLRHPTGLVDQEVLIRGASSPVHLDANDPETKSPPVMLVRSPGYAWELVRLQGTLGGTTRVRLQPAGKLEVSLFGATAPDYWYFRLRRADADRSVYLEREVPPRNHFLVESIAPGDYIATVEIGHRYGSTREIAAQPVTISAVEGAWIEFEIEGLEATPTAPLAGTLVLPTEWELSSFGLIVDRVSQAVEPDSVQRYVNNGSMTDLGDGLYRWALPEMPIGDYEISVNPLGFPVPVTLGPEGNTNVRIEVPAPAIVRFTTWDAQSGAVAPIAGAAWQPARDDLQSGGVFNTTISRQPGVFEVRTTPGVLHVLLDSDDFAPRSHHLRVEPGLNELRLDLTRTCGLLLSLRDGDTLLPLDRELGFVVEQVGGEGEGELAGLDDQGLRARVRVDHPGRYRLMLNELDGYWPVSERELQIPEATFVEHVIDLERRP